jgi:hypothetical protein
MRKSESFVRIHITLVSSRNGVASRFSSELGVRGTMRLPNRKEETGAR